MLNPNGMESFAGIPCTTIIGNGAKHYIVYYQIKTMVYRVDIRANSIEHAVKLFCNYYGIRVKKVSRTANGYYRLKAGVAENGSVPYDDALLSVQHWN